MNKTIKVHDSIKNLTDLNVWDNLTSAIKNKDLVKKFKKVPLETYIFAYKKSNRKFLVKSALKSLRRTNPKATLEHAESLADMLNIFARMYISEVETIIENKKTRKNI